MLAYLGPLLSVVGPSARSRVGRLIWIGFPEANTDHNPASQEGPSPSMYVYPSACPLLHRLSISHIASQIAQLPRGAFAGPATVCCAVDQRRRPHPRGPMRDRCNQINYPRTSCEPLCCLARGICCCAGRRVRVYDTVRSITLYMRISDYLCVPHPICASKVATSRLSW